MFITKKRLFQILDSITKINVKALQNCVDLLVIQNSLMEDLEARTTFLEEDITDLENKIIDLEKNTHQKKTKEKKN